MNIIKDFQELPNEEITTLIKNFRVTQKKGIIKNVMPNKSYINEYNKQFIDVSDKLMESIKKIILSYFPNNKITYRFSRLNKIETDTNTHDDFHTDSGSGNIIFLHYPKDNPEYEGGELEIENLEKIYPVNGMNLLLIDNPPHRVLNVTKGERYSFAFFFDRYKTNHLI